MESFFVLLLLLLLLLQKNVLDRKPWVTMGERRLAIVVWIERSQYRMRQHHHLRRITPIEFRAIKRGL